MSWERFHAFYQGKVGNKGQPKDPPGGITVRTGGRLTSISWIAQQSLTRLDVIARIPSRESPQNEL
jgi:hypothetical protein